MELNTYLAQNTSNLSDAEKQVLGLDPKLAPTPTDAGGKTYTREELYAMCDPITKKHYAIPFLSQDDPDYRKKYIELMQTRIDDPNQFNKIMAGD